MIFCTVCGREYVRAYDENGYEIWELQSESEARPAPDHSCPTEEKNVAVVHGSGDRKA